MYLIVILLIKPPISVFVVICINLFGCSSVVFKLFWLSDFLERLQNVVMQLVLIRNRAHIHSF